MAFVTWPTAFTDDVSSIPAAALNQWRVDLGRAVDGNAGGAYLPTSVIEIGNAGLKAGGVTKVLLGTRTVTRLSEPIPCDFTGSTTWTNRGAAWFQAVTNSNYLFLPIHVPEGATLNTVVVRVRGWTGHGALPAVMPHVRIWTYNFTTDVSTEIGAAIADTAASVAAYEAAHSITFPSIATVADRTQKYFYALVRGESGANSITDLRMLGLTAAYTPVAYDED